LFRRASTQIAQGDQPPRADNLFGRFDASTEHAINRASIGGENRAVAECDIYFFARQVAREEHLKVFDRSRSSRCHFGMHWTNRWPDFAPDLASRFAERTGMLYFTKEGNVRIVVYQPQIGTDPKQDRKSGV
jgi:hypothetical protein